MKVTSRNVAGIDVDCACVRRQLTTRARRVSPRVAPPRAGPSGRRHSRNISSAAASTWSLALTTSVSQQKNADEAGAEECTGQAARPLPVPDTDLSLRAPESVGSDHLQDAPKYFEEAVGERRHRLSPATRDYSKPHAQRRLRGGRSPYRVSRRSYHGQPEPLKRRQRRSTGTPVSAAPPEATFMSIDAGRRRRRFRQCKTRRSTASHLLDGRSSAMPMSRQVLLERLRTPMPHAWRIWPPRHLEPPPSAKLARLREAFSRRPSIRQPKLDEAISKLK